MLTPLSLVPRKNIQNKIEDYECSPSIHRMADSLVFSITSQKNYSPKDSNLLDSRPQEVSKELEELQYKLQSLQDKVENIHTQRFFSQKSPLQLTERANFREKYPNNSYLFDKNKQNMFHQPKQAGKIIKKDRSLSKSTNTVKVSRIKQIIHTNNETYSRNSALSNVSKKGKQLAKLKDQIKTMRQSIQKSERSRSACSQRLSQSKSLVKNLKKKDKKNQKVISGLRQQLKKSETIRQKQKEVILRQQEQINHYRQLLRLSKPIR